MAGDGTPDNQGDGGPGSRAKLHFPTGVAVTPQGGVLVASAGQVRRVGVDGLIFTEVGTCAATTGDDGLPARVACLNTIYGLATTALGEIFLTEGSFEKGHRVYKVATDGYLTAVGGKQPALDGDGGPASLTKTVDPQAVAILPNGDVVFAEHSESRVRALRPTFPGPALTGEMRIADPSGDFVQVFDRLRQPVPAVLDEGERQR